LKKLFFCFFHIFTWWRAALASISWFLTLSKHLEALKSQEELQSSILRSIFLSKKMSLNLLRNSLSSTFHCSGYFFLINYQGRFISKRWFQSWDWKWFLELPSQNKYWSLSNVFYNQNPQELQHFFFRILFCLKGKSIHSFSMFFFNIISRRIIPAFFYHSARS